ncbi:hypothetical protein [Streptacidiphilus rugosus]|uniref:hypothetical protein n=1 Tax=Streptacidiphilus rugosus TaxID=405783 RepID=UPI00056A9590|nr:hypothetical protein [Streptacidiphilus rugosus]
MLLLGLLLLCATGAFTGLLIAGNLSGGPDYQVVVLGNTIATMNSLEIFLSGLALALIFCLALAMMGVGGRMASRRRAVLRGARHAAAPEATTTAPATSVPIETAPVETVPAETDENERPMAGSGAGRRHRHLFGH